jgi:hypothetical protein
MADARPFRRADIGEVDAEIGGTGADRRGGKNFRL